MAVRMGVEVKGLKELLVRVRALPKAAQSELREAAKRIATFEAERISAAASGSSKQAAAIAGFIKARSDRVPSISAGGNRKTGLSGGARAGEVFFGAEFGGQARPSTQQFRPHRGQQGYFFFPTLRATQDRQIAMYEQALAQIEREWAR